MFQILTDSGSERIPAADMSVVPLTVMYDEHTSFPDGQMAPAEFYAGIRAGKLPKTSAVNPEQWTRPMEAILGRGEDVLVITLAAALSGTHQSAVIAADELREQYPQQRIRVIDSTTASHALGLLVEKATELRDAGGSMDAVADWVEAHKKNYCVWLAVEDLMHLKRGGRLGAAAAVAGTMLQIKPLLHLTDGGHLESGPKVRGRKAMLHTLTELVRSNAVPGEPVTVGHSACPEDAEVLAELLRKDCGIQRVQVGSIGTVIGAHVGPGALTVCFVAENGR